MARTPQDEHKNKDQLINELVILRQRMAELEILETKHKQAEEALRESEETYRALVNHMTEGYMVVRGDRILFANRRWVEILGIPAHELIGENYWKLIPQENQVQTKQAFKKVTDGGEVPTLWEFVHPGKDGRGIPIEVSIREVIYKGKPSYAVVLRDITERKWAEEVLQESERVLSQIVESNSIATFVIDKEHRITHWNKACEKLTGISASEVIGTKRQWLPLYSTERPVLAEVKYGKSSMIEGAYEVEDFFPHFGASGKWLYSTAAPLRNNDGNIIGAIETLQDINRGNRDLTGYHRAQAGRVCSKNIRKTISRSF